jgi:hypothetical protein
VGLYDSGRIVSGRTDRAQPTVGLYVFLAAPIEES